MSLDPLNTFISAAGAAAGVFAAFAAWRSAGHARAAQSTAERMAQRQAVKEVAEAASEILVEHQRIQARAQDLKLGYTSLFALNNASTNSNLPQYLDRVKSKMDSADMLAADAKLFSDGASSLNSAEIEEVHRVGARLRSSCVTLRGYREDFDQEQRQVAEWSAEARSRRERGKL
jgi:hypothetical protein